MRQLLPLEASGQGVHINGHVDGVGPGVLCRL